MPKITKIEATIDLRTHAPIQKVKKRRTAGYARVSTGNDEQATSYEAQMEYYTKYIQANPGWEFVGMYADEGISGTSTKQRSGFRDMIKDALDGKIDLILAKSISRFARNTVDSLVNIRNLKDHGVEVYFEKENIWTFDEKGEVMLTIMSSLAQEESRSISENVTWGKRRSFEEGKYSVPFKRFLGYERGSNGELVINKEQAAIVRNIYRWFIEGRTVNQICQELMRLGIKTPGGKEKWQSSTVFSILTNEKYKGAAMLQKSYTVDFLNKKKKANNGELPKYYIEDAHPAIIPPADWEIVQDELAARKRFGTGISAQSFLSCKLMCEDCGGYYGSKVWHSTSSYRKIIYRCNRKYDNEVRCETPVLTEEEVKELFIMAYNEYMGDRERIISDAVLLCGELSDTSKIEAKLEVRKKELGESADLYRLLITNESSTSDGDDFQSKEKKIYHEYSKLSDEVSDLSDRLAEINSRRYKLESYIESMRTRPNLLEEWDAGLWVTMIDHCVVHRDKTVTFVFRDGKEITE